MAPTVCSSKKHVQQHIWTNRGQRGGDLTFLGRLIGKPLFVPVRVLGKWQRCDVRRN
jgi:hypothetical protein